MNLFRLSNTLLLIVLATLFAVETSQEAPLETTRLVLRSLPPVPAPEETPQPMVPLGHRLPGQVLAYVSLPSVADFLERGAEATDPELTRTLFPFLASCDANSDKFSACLRDELLVDFDELCDLGSAGLCVGLVKPRTAPMALLVLVDVHAHPELAEQVVGRFVDAAGDSAGSVEEADVTVYNVDRVTEDVDRTYGFCIKDGVLCVSSSRETLSEVLRQWDRSDENLAGRSEAFFETTSIDPNADRDPALSWYADPMGLLHELVELEDRDGPVALWMEQMVSRVGLDGLRGVGGTFDFGTGDVATVARVQIALKRPVSGFCGVFKFNTGRHETLATLTHSAPSSLSFHWDLEAAYDGLDAILTLIGDKHGLRQHVARYKLLENFHLKDELLDRLTGQVEMASTPDGLVTVLSFRDREQLDALVSAWEIPSGDDEQLVMTCSTRDAEALPIRALMCGPLGQAFGLAVGDKLALATDPAALTAVMETPSESRPEYGFETVAHMSPEQSLLQAYDREDLLFKWIYQFAASCTWSELFGETALSPPPYESVRHLVGPSVACAVENESGVLFERRTLRRQPRDEAPQQIAQGTLVR